MAYLTTNNTKIQKGLEQGFLTFGIHFAPAKLSGFDVCSEASDGCREACLNTSGLGQTPNVQEARVKKTKLFLSDIKKGLEDISDEITKATKKALKLYLTPCFRLNLTSDLPWEKLRLANGKNLFEQHPNVQFYDYTKIARRMNLNIPNYHLTFSRSEAFGNQVQAAQLLKEGKNVAAVFSTKKGEELPESWKGYKVVDGDKDDLRFLDIKNCIVGLRAKGKARKDNSGFVIQVK
jgi:hypothetical protein